MTGIINEIKFKTARSGGKGGQNVNKVETMVEGYWNIEGSILINQEQKALIKEKLEKKINTEGNLLVKSQDARTQIANKQLVVKKMNELVRKALVIQKKRKATKPSKTAILKRLETKKKTAIMKEGRKKITNDD